MPQGTPRHSRGVHRTLLAGVEVKNASSMKFTVSPGSTPTSCSRAWGTVAEGDTWTRGLGKRPGWEGARQMKATCEPGWAEAGGRLGRGRVRSRACHELVVLVGNRLCADDVVVLVSGGELEPQEWLACTPTTVRGGFRDGEAGEAAACSGQSVQLVPESHARRMKRTPPIAHAPLMGHTTLPPPLAARSPPPSFPPPSPHRLPPLGFLLLTPTHRGAAAHGGGVDQGQEAHTVGQHLALGRRDGHHGAGVVVGLFKPNLLGGLYAKAAGDGDLRGTGGAQATAVKNGSAAVPRSQLDSQGCR